LPLPVRRELVRGQEPAQEPGLELELGPGPVLELELVPGLELELVPGLVLGLVLRNQQSNLRLATIPAELTIFSFSPIYLLIKFMTQPCKNSNC